MEINYTNATHVHESKWMKFTWKHLHSATFDFNSPFQFNLADEQQFFVDHVIRIVPKKRLVAYAKWQGKPAIVKLFYDGDHANLHMAREVSGIKLLQKCHVPTPALYYEGVSEDRRVSVLIFEFIPEAKNLDELWQEKNHIEDMLPLLETLMIELATQHVYGIVQKDLHFKNFLVAKNTIYTLDGAQIEFKTPLLCKKKSLDHLARLLSQFGIGFEHYQKSLFTHYAKARAWLLKNEDFDELFQLIEKWDAIRWKKYAKKIFRESTDHKRIRINRLRGMCQRTMNNPDFQQFLANPDYLFTLETTQFLKRGCSSSVIKTTFDGKEYVVKRNNIKNGWHFLRRCFRRTRAAHSWLIAHKFALFNITTAKPIAFLDERRWGLRGKSYYITEYITGGGAGDYLQNIEQEEKKYSMIGKIILLLKGIMRIGITHGDLKITNILINSEEQPTIIDFDGAKEQSSKTRLKNIWRQEQQRFLRNFDQQPLLAEAFKLALNEKDFYARNK